MSGERYNVAIDGPAGAGKSTVARLVAGHLGFIYVDTGAMYRAIAWEAIQAGIEADDPDKITALAKGLDLRLHPSEQGQRILVNGNDVTDRIRSVEVNRRVSQVAQIAAVRQLLVAKQKQLAAGKGVVMDGRDIGTHVLPDAEIKIFLTASVEERAMRRYKEMLAAGQDVDLERLQQEISVRDKMDEQREVSPLVKAQDAVLVDTTGMAIPQVVKHILALCDARTKSG